MAADNLYHDILNKSLELAAQSSWEKMRLYDVAAALDLSLDQVREHFAQKDDLVEAWYDRADSTMLTVAEEAAFLKLDMPHRLHKLIMTWLDELAKYKTVSRDMLLYKLEPGHVHLQVLGVMRISRTVQWIREAAQQDSIHLRRILEEIGLTSIYLITFVYWMNDASDRQQRTRDYLERKLKRARRFVDVMDEWFPNRVGQPNQFKGSE